MKSWWNKGYVVPVSMQCWCRLWPALSGCRRSAVQHPEAWQLWWCPQPSLRQTHCRCSHLLQRRKVRHEEGGAHSVNHTDIEKHTSYDGYVNIHTHKPDGFIHVPISFQSCATMCRNVLIYLNMLYTVVFAVLHTTCILSDREQSAYSDQTEQHMTGDHCCTHTFFIDLPWSVWWCRGGRDGYW